MEYKIVIGKSAYDLNNAVAEFAKEGWTPKGSHQVVTRHEQNRFAGTQHKDTIYEVEYSQTMVKETRKNVIEVDIMFGHPDDENGNVDETIKVYDTEGMREEFEIKLNELD